MALSLVSGLSGRGALASAFLPTREESATIDAGERAYINDLLKTSVRIDRRGRLFVEIGDERFDAAQLQRTGFAGAKWTGGFMSYEFAPDVTPGHRALFNQYKAEWEAVSGVQIVENSLASNRLMVINTSDPNICGYSSLGMQGGVQDLAIGPNCWGYRTIVHELGHALGLAHEQQRADRDSYIQYFPGNVCSGYASQFATVGTVNLSPYDFRSIMHYHSRAFGLPVVSGICQQQSVTMERIDDPSDQLINNTLSELDALGMQARYGWHVRVAVTGDGGGSYSFSAAESCGPDCFQVTFGGSAMITAQPDGVSMALISRPCSGRASCQFTPSANALVRISLLRRRTLASLWSPSIVDPQLPFSSGFETGATGDWSGASP